MGHKLFSHTLIAITGGLLATGYVAGARPPRTEAAVTWTAIALAESGGNAEVTAPGGEDSRGLWQINRRGQS